MSFLRSLFSTAPPAPSGELHCSFCGKSRLEVQKLIAGPSAYICDECVALSAELIARDGPSPEYQAGVAIALVEQLDARTPHAEVRPFLRAAIELARDDRALLVRAAAAARRFDDAETALHALRRIPRATAVAADVLDEAALLIQLDRFGEALGVLHSIAPATMTELDRITHRLHVIYAQLREEADEATARTLRSAVATLEAEVDALGDPGTREGMHDYRLAVLANAHLRLGDARAALVIADARVEQTPHAPGPHDLRARALEALGDGPGADAARRAAIERAHPNGHYARRAASTGAPFR